MFAVSVMRTLLLLLKTKLISRVTFEVRPTHKNYYRSCGLCTLVHTQYYVKLYVPRSRPVV